MIEENHLRTPRMFLCTLALLLVLGSSCFGGDDLFFSQPGGPIRSRLAATVGTPSGLNISGSYWGPNTVGYRLTLGYIPGQDGRYIGGGQLELTCKVYEKRKTIIDLSVGAGRSDIKLEDKFHRWSYGGFFFTLNSRALFLQGGLTFGSDDYVGPPSSPEDSGAFGNPQLAFQIGLSLMTTRDN